MKKLLGIVVLGLLWSNIAQSEKIPLICIQDSGQDEGFSRSYLIDNEKKEITFEHGGKKKYTEKRNRIEWFSTATNDEGNVTEYIVNLDRYTGKKKVLWRPQEKKRQRKLGLKKDEYNVWTEQCEFNPKYIF